jgi:hypothetical protein
MALKLADAIVAISGDRSQLTKDLGSSETQTKGWVKKASGAMNVFFGNMLTGVVSKATDMVGGLVSGVKDMVMEASAMEGVTNTFGKLTEAIGTDAVSGMEALRTATRGMIADTDLMAAGNKFMAMGLADSEEQMAKLSEIATQLGMAMGEDATASMENFALMMANQSTPRLDSFGISSGAVKERIAELMETVEGMTKEVAFNTAVMEQAEITMAKVGEQGDNSAASFARMQAQMANLKQGIGAALIPVMNALLVPIAALLTQHGPRLVEWAKLIGEWLGGRIPQAIKWLQALLGVLPDAVALGSADLHNVLDRLSAACNRSSG